MTGRAARRGVAALLLAALTALLGGCLLMAGKYDASLDVRRDGRFTFAYSGEIYLAALGKLAEMGREAKAAAVFKPEDCPEAEDASGAAQRAETGKPAPTRPCTPAELAEQRKAWEANRAEQAATRKREAEGFKAMLGGIDPGNPAAAEEFAARLRKQAGWRKVVYKGDGRYDVDFRIEGRLDRDFAFPTVERLPAAQAFVTISRRQDATLRIDAPGLAALSGGALGNPMLSALAMGAAKEGKAPALPQPEGRFALTTDAAILANNTEEGPKADAAGQQLVWNTASSQVTAAPMVLLQLAR